MMRKGLSEVITVIIMVITATTVSAARAGESPDFERLLADKAPVLVSVKFVLKVSMGSMMGGDQENETEITGVMIDAKGLILCSNTQLGGFTAIMKRMMGSMGGSISATPTDLKVLIGEDEDGMEAELLARDTELDLAWIRIKEPGDKVFDHVDFAKAAKPTVGQRVFAVRRLGKFFGRAPSVVDGNIGGSTDKPRDLYIPTGAIGTAMGLPVYTMDGRVVGVTIMQAPDAEDAGMNPMAMLSQMSNMQDMFSGLILPAKDVAKATKRALESLDTEQAE
jgi:S1-C subfamily serine protease